MKHFNRFLEEIGTLVISSKEGYITEDEEILPNDIMLNRPYRRIPVLDLSLYDYHSKSNRYKDLLKKLSDKAQTDLLSKKEMKRALAMTERKHASLDRIYKKALELKKEFKKGGPEAPTYSDFERQILDSFEPPNEVKGGIDLLFVNNLIKALMYKRAVLKDFMNAIQMDLNVNTPTQINEEAPFDKNRPVVSVPLSTTDDPVRLQRGMINLVQQWHQAKGKPIPYRHPYLYHTKHYLGQDGRYVLFVNKDEEVVDEEGKIIEHKKIPLTDNDVNEAFIQYITSCPITEILPFLDAQFQWFYNSLPGNQSTQPFFEHIIALIDVVNDRGLLYKVEADIILNWLQNNPHYTVELNGLGNLENNSPAAGSQKSLISERQTSVIQKNSFNEMPLENIEKWFMQLATSKNSNNQPFLSDEEVRLFVQRGFVGKTDLPKLSINLAKGDTRSVMKLFYLFFDFCRHDYGIEPTKQCKEKYVRLLTDNFTNYNYDTVFKTFNNSKGAAKKWDTTIL